MEAYSAVYDLDLREELEEEKEVQELAFQIIENAAYVLFSQGYGVEDLVDYFSEASEEVITEDFVGFTEGKAYLSESLIVPQQHIEEQFRQLNEISGLVRGAINLGSKIFGAGAGATKASKITSDITRATNTGAKVTTSGVNPAREAISKAIKLPARVTTSGGRVTGNLFQRAVGTAKGALRSAAPALKGFGAAGKVAGKALPGVGAALYGIDAADRFKKGDWGGGLLSTAGAVTSLVPGAGLVAGLAPLGIQMATDAAGLTGDKSLKKGAPPTPKPPKTPGAPPTPKPPKTPGAPPTPKPPKTPGAPPTGKTAPTPPGTPTDKGKFPTATTRGGTQYQVRTPTRAEMEASRQAGGGEKGVKAAVELSKMQSSVDKDMQRANSPEELNKLAPPGTALAAEQERRRKAREQSQAVNSSYEYDAYDLVLEYLFQTGQVETVSEAQYIMMEMDSETIGSIVEEMIM